MENVGKIVEFLYPYLHKLLIVTIHYALNCWQPETAGNNFQRAADFLSTTAVDNSHCRQFSADKL